MLRHDINISDGDVVNSVFGNNVRICSAENHIVDWVFDYIYLSLYVSFQDAAGEA